MGQPLHAMRMSIICGSKRMDFIGFRLFGFGREGTYNKSHKRVVYAEHTHSAPLSYFQIFKHIVIVADKMVFGLLAMPKVKECPR